MSIFLLLLAVLAVMYMFVMYDRDGFGVYWSGGSVTNNPVSPMVYGPQFGYWPQQMLRHTTNMSYDMRGDPLAIPKQSYIWNNSDLSPIYNPPAV
ncbi:MAG: hypothetical protein Gaeavirus15_7 [Gaeavirus sp.]|uniref:Uncharacterized protein n=1 Tax=Gaeavirus sp. TaxID=2487767 RepID=A0A3G4ZZ53_9VIRU|nr:MAG: hypothetical protein Gaeavirus15_7 [Gaeavirus sp.]